MSISLACCAAPAGGAYAGRFHFTSIDVPGQASSQALAVNDRDEVVGYATIGGSNASENFAWSKGKLTQAPASGNNDISGLFAINHVGWALGIEFGGGFAWDDSGYVWRFGSKTSQPLKGPAGYNFVPAGINAGNVIVGTAWSSSGGKIQASGYIAHGNRVELLSAPDLPGATEFVAINDAGLIAGASFTAPFFGYGFTYRNGTYTQVLPPGASASTILFVSPGGIVGGWYSGVAGSSNPIGFTWDGTTYRSYSQASSNFSEVVGIGPQGQIFGNGATAFVVVNKRYFPISFPGAAITSINAVGANGTIVGSYNDANGMTHAFIATCAASHAPCTR